MKEFFKTMFASVFGVLIAFGIIIFGGISFLIGMALSSSSSAVYKPQANTVFKLTLSGTLSDQTTDDPFASLLGDDEEKLSLIDVIKAIRTAEKNDNIKGIYLDVKNLQGGFASFEAIHRELVNFKKSGKFIVSYGDTYGQGNYYLSSVADSILVNPQGSINLVGLASQGIFFKDLAAKLGVEFYIFKVGTYKSAVEPFFMDKFSDANREQLTSFLGSIWNNMTTGICESRNIPQEKLMEFINSGASLSETQAVIDSRLADKLCYRSEAETTIKRMAGQDMDKKLVTADIKKILSIKADEKEKKNKIAILYAEGEIKEDDSSLMGSMENVISEKMVKELNELAKDEDVKAVVFRVNSPGGSAYISEQIWKAVTEVKAQKPIVVSMGDYAASGGYYISAGADRIFAEKTTITGSIGIYGMIPNVKRLANDKLGITADFVSTSPNSNLSAFEPLTPTQRNAIQRNVNRGYELFVARCAKGRHKTTDEIKAIAEGRVWDGESAKEIGLVDQFGGIEDATKWVANKAKLGRDFKVKIYPEFKPDFINLLYATIERSATIRMQQSYNPELLRYALTVQDILNKDRIQCRMEDICLY